MRSLTCGLLLSAVILLLIDFLLDTGAVLRLLLLFFSLLSAGIEIPKYVDKVTPEYKPKFDSLVGNNALAVFLNYKNKKKEKGIKISSIFLLIFTIFYSILLMIYFYPFSIK